VLATTNLTFEYVFEKPGMYLSDSCRPVQALAETDISTKYGNKAAVWGAVKVQTCSKQGVNYKWRGALP
jgi:hypothetical protein